MKISQITDRLHFRLFPFSSMSKSQLYYKNYIIKIYLNILYMLSRIVYRILVLFFSIFLLFSTDLASFRLPFRCCFIKNRLTGRQLTPRVYYKNERDNNPQNIHKHKVEPEIDGMTIFAVNVSISVLSEEVEDCTIQLTCK